MIADFIKRYEKSLGIEDISVTSPMYLPLIWVKHKETKAIACCVTFYDEAVFVGECNNEYSMCDMFECYTYLDGSPCGVEE